MKKTKIILSLLFLMSFNDIVPMYGGFAQGGGARGGGQVEQNDYLTPDDFDSFVVKQFTFDGVDDYQQLYETISGIYNRRLNYAWQLGLPRFPLKTDVIGWIDNIVSRRQPKEVAVELTPKQLEPVDLHCSSSTEPYFVTRQTLKKLEVPKHPVLQCEFTALELPDSFDTWVSSGKLSSNAWKAELDKGCQVSAEVFNLTGLSELVAKSPVDAVLAQAIAPSLEQRDANGYTRLILATLRKDNDEVKRLIEAGANVDAKLNADPALPAASFDFPLSIAAADNLPAVELLIKAKADVNNKTASGRTALMIATRRGKIDIVRLLLESGADVNTPDAEGVTGLMHAILLNRPDIVNLLIEAGADVNSKTNSGWTSLMIAAYYGREEVIDLLLAACPSPDVDAEDFQNRTALMHASAKGHSLIAQKLTKAGAKK